MAMKTPGVYIVEKSAFPNSVVEVATAVPAFIGYTEKAENGNLDLSGVPKRLSSMGEFLQFFGGAPTPKFVLNPVPVEPKAQLLSKEGITMTDPLPDIRFNSKGPAGPVVNRLVQTTPDFCLWASVKLFFENGGGDCWVVSIGKYTKKIAAENPGEPEQTVDNTIEAQPMKDALKALKKEQEPTMIVIPEATRLPRIDCISVQQAALKHCGAEMRNRFAILDVFGGHLPLDGELGKPVDTFRNELGTDNLDYGAAYYPWLDSSAFGASDFTFENVEESSRQDLIKLLGASVGRNAELKSEIARLSAPKVEGDFTVSVPSGGTVALTTEDFSADDDDTADDTKLIYTVTGSDAAMGGQIIKTGTSTKLPDFTQDQLAKGEVSFKHDGKTEKGKFGISVVDEFDIPTGTFDVAVELVGDVLPIAGVKEGKASAEVDVTLGVKDPDKKSVTFPESDAANKKTLKVGGVGVWTALDTGKVTFKPDPDFPGPEANATYQLKSGEKEIGPFSLKVMITGGPLATVAKAGPTNETIDKMLRANVPLYQEMTEAIAKRANTMPPSAIMAGIYTRVDNSRGVWKAPANESVASVAGPTIVVSHGDQENLNVSTTGKSINAIRPFVGEGTLVWGARTLDGNSLDWRYISVRRTMIMIEESIRLASKAYVFEPNTANTWVTMRSMIENFLTNVWKDGGLAGSTPTDAFSVHVGLGETMTPVDILEGILRITVLVAVTRPAEFIEITFQQQMQKS